MAFVQYDHMIEQIPAAVTNSAFSNSVLPGTSETGPFGFVIQDFDRIYHILIEVRRPIEDQILRRRIAGECLPQLLHDPSTAWVSGHIAMKNTPPVMRNDEEAVQHTKGQRRHGKEVHRSNRFPMIAQEGHPSFFGLRASRCSPHPVQDGSLRNIEAKHRQLAMNARSSPGRVLDYHAEDGLTQFQADPFPSQTNAMPREPGPIRFESGTIPSHHGVRLNEQQCLLPSVPEPSQYYAEQSIRSGKSRPRPS